DPVDVVLEAAFLGDPLAQPGDVTGGDAPGVRAGTGGPQRRVQGGGAGDVRGERFVDRGIDGDGRGGVDDDVRVAGQLRHDGDGPLDDGDAARDLPLGRLLAHAFAPRGATGFANEFADA